MRFRPIRPFPLILTVILAAALRADVAPPRPRLLTPDVYATAGADLSITLLMPAATPGGAATQGPPRQLTLIWVAGNRTEETVFTLQPSPAQPVTLNGNDYWAYDYSGPVPGGLLGPAIVEAREIPRARALVSVQTKRTSQLLASTLESPPPAAPATIGTSAAGIDTAAPAKAGAHERLLRRAVRAPLIPGISANEPTYFILGYRPGLNARFQISFKYQPFEATWLRHLGAAFTTTSLWDLHSTSLPFKDSTYRPSFSWYGDPRPFLGRKDLRLTWQVAAWEHESNGRGETNIAQTAAGSDSRSLNIGFVRPTLTWQVAEKDTLSVALKLYTYYNRARENRDIADYRGYADLALRYLHDDWVLSTLLRKGGRGYFAEFNLGIPENIFLSWFSQDLEKKDVHGWLLLQYLSGYGETLLDYNQRIPDQVRVGLMVIP